MAKQHTLKKRRSLRRKSVSRKRGGGYEVDVRSMINPGNPLFVQYPGPGKDCTGNPHSIRAGYISSFDPKGLPGLRGGKRRDRKVGGQVVRSTPGVPIPTGSTMSGGRYGFFPYKGPLNPVNGVGVSPAPFGRIPCEGGAPNPLNPNPGNIQNLTTAPLLPPYVARGGGNFPTVQVGQADAMRYYAPTAGYTNDFMTFRAPSPVPGLTIQTPYDARAFNQACIKTGGGKKNKKNKGGALPVALDAGAFTPVKMSEIWTRKDFDDTDKGLPVRFGGGRRVSRRVLKRKQHTHKKRS